jgi:hypothetical protein
MRVWNPTARKVWCPSYGWRGDRTKRDGPDPYGACRACGAPVTPTSILADRRRAKAQTELAQLQTAAPDPIDAAARATNDAIIRGAVRAWLQPTKENT